MNILSLSPRLTNSETIHGIAFRNCAILELKIDGLSISSYGDFKDCLPVFAELDKSSLSSGKFLVLTCACGIADDAGLSGIEVTHADGVTFWKGDGLSFSFDSHQYRAEIASCRTALAKLPARVSVEPTSFAYPEDWNS